MKLSYSTGLKTKTKKGYKRFLLSITALKNNKDGIYKDVIIKDVITI
jgi:hypothetical protein